VDASIAHYGWEGTNVTGSSLILGICGTRTANLVGLVVIFVLEYRVTGSSLIIGRIRGTRTANLVGRGAIVFLEYRVTGSSIIIGIRGTRTAKHLVGLVVIVVFDYRVQQKSAPDTSQSPCQGDFLAPVVGLMSVVFLGCSRHGGNSSGCVCDVVN
jgi:hypothetical protein